MMRHASMTFCVSALFFIAALVLMFTQGCTAPSPTPTAISGGATIVVPFTPNPQDVALPTLLPTVEIPTQSSASPSPVVITEIPSITPVAVTVTRRPPTRAPQTPTPAESATPFPEGLPKVFVTALRVEPATPKAAVGGTFFVTFQNASGENQGYNWAVEIWEGENTRRPFGLTTPQNSPMPLGTSNYTSTGWTVKGLGECRAYRARVVSRDQDDNRATFLQPDGSILWLDFTVCP